jgi:hypothetical protein
LAAIAKSGTPSMSSVLPPQNNQIAGLLAGAAIAAGDACYINSSGAVIPSTGAAANAAAKVRGFAAEAADSGRPVTLLFDVNFRYGAGLTPGIDVYLSGTTAGALDTATSTGGTAPIGFVVDATRIRLFQSRY